MHFPQFIAKISDDLISGMIMANILSLFEKGLEFFLKWVQNVGHGHGHSANLIASPILWSWAVFIAFYLMEVLNLFWKSFSSFPITKL